MKLTKSQLKEMIRQAIVEDIMDKEIENPKTGNKIKVRTALQLPDEHPANKKAKDMVAKSPTKDDDEPMVATPAPKGKSKGPMKNPFSKESPAFEPKQKEIDKELIKKSDDIVKQFQNGEYESLEDLVMNAHPDEIQDSDIFNKIPDVGQNFDAAMEYYYDLNDHEMGVGAPADYDEDQLKNARKQLFKALTTSKDKKESVKESKKRRYTVKEVRMWMKKLEENRYKKVYNSDARRVAWMVNNEGRTLDEMPISMKKKWTKAQYGRERYLATEFLKSKSEQMTEGKLTEISSKAVQGLKDKKGNMWDYHWKLPPRERYLAAFNVPDYKLKDGVTKINIVDFMTGKGKFNWKKEKNLMKQIHKINDKLKIGVLVDEGKLSEKQSAAVQRMAKKGMWVVYDTPGEQTIKVVKNERAAKLLVKKLKKSGKYNSPEAKAIKLEGKLTSEQLSEGFDLKKLEIVIKSIQKKIAKQGRVTNARDEDHLKQLIKVYKQMGGKKIKEQMNESKLRGMIREIIKEQLNEQKLMKILLNKKDMSKLQKVMKKYPFKSLPKFKQKGSDIELNVPKKEYNKAVEFLMKNKLNPRG